MEKDFRSFFDEWSKSYDTTVNGEDEEYREVFAKYDTILNEVADRASSPVLEFGVGTGNLTERLERKGKHVFGVEPSREMRIIARKKLPNIDIRDGHFLQFDSPSEKVHSIVSTYAFHHLTDDEKERAIKQFAHVLPYGGKIVFADTVFESEEAKNEIQECAKKKGYKRLLKDLQTEYYTTLPILTELMAKNGFQVKYKKMNDFVWLIEAVKEEKKMSKKMNVESFNLDHTKVDAPYVRLAGAVKGGHGDIVYKYDLRFKQPNKEHMEMPSLHSLEHLMAELSRNHAEHIVDISPMGCQTGFYLSLLNDDSLDNVHDLVEKTLRDVLKANEVPACNEVQCGWAASHSLEGAKELASDMLAKKDKWHIVFQQ